jgi:hypothetical protein
MCFEEVTEMNGTYAVKVINGGAQRERARATNNLLWAVKAWVQDYVWQAWKRQ